MATEVSDIRVLRFGTWRTMVHTRVFDGTDWRIFKKGDGIFHNGEWYVVSSKETIVVYLTPSMRVMEDGVMMWRITVATVPDVLLTYEAEISVDMTISMSDGNVYYVSGTADGDNQYINTSIPYVDGVDISNLQATATSSNANYTISEVIFTGMYNLLNLENDGTE